MKRLIGLLIVIALLTGCGGGGSGVKPKETLLKPYSNKYYGIMYPQDFLKFEESDGNGAEIFMAVMPGEVSYHLSVLRMPTFVRNMEPSEFEGFVQAAINMRRDDLQTQVISHSRFSLIQGNPALKITYTRDVYGEEQEKRMDIVTYHKNVLVMITFGSKTSQFDSRLEVFNEIVDEFRFLF